MEKLLTVTVPVYNMERYLRLCLSSFIVEKSVMDQVEILVIDDGSVDQSADIAREYVRRYPDTFRLIRKENGGHGSALNRGICEAQGTYFKVVDSDDWVEAWAFCALVRKLRTCNSDVVYSNYYWVDDISGSRSVEFVHPFEQVEYDREYQVEEIQADYFLKMHGYTIKTEILRAMPRMDEHCFYVDMEFVLFPVPFVDTVTFLDAYIYRYRIGRSGQSMSAEKLMKQSENFDRVLARVLGYYDAWKGSVSLSKKRYMEHILARMVASRMKIFLCCPYDRTVQMEMKAFDHFVWDQYKEVYKAIQNKIVLGLQLSHYSLYSVARCVYYWKDRMNQNEVTKADIKRYSKRKYLYKTV